MAKNETAKRWISAASVDGLPAATLWQPRLLFGFLELAYLSLTICLEAGKDASEERTRLQQSETAATALLRRGFSFSTAQSDPHHNTQPANQPLPLDNVEDRHLWKGLSVASKLSGKKEAIPFSIGTPNVYTTTFVPMAGEMKMNSVRLKKHYWMRLAENSVWEVVK